MFSIIFPAIYFLSIVGLLAIFGAVRYEVAKERKQLETEMFLEYTPPCFSRRLAGFIFSFLTTICPLTNTIIFCTICIYYKEILEKVLDEYADTFFE